VPSLSHQECCRSWLGCCFCLCCWPWAMMTRLARVQCGVCYQQMQLKYGRWINAYALPEILTMRGTFSAVLTSHGNSLRTWYILLESMGP
jgi:hypothetical protein